MTLQEKPPFRIAFIHAPDPVYSDTQNYGAKFMPVWAYTLAAHIPDDGRFTTTLYDCRFEPEENITEHDIFLFSGMNQDNGNMEAVRARLQAHYPASKSMIGGPIAWSFDQAGSLDMLDGYDHVFIGDGEAEITPLLEAFRMKKTVERVNRAKERFSIGNAKPFF